MASCNIAKFFNHVSLCRKYKGIHLLQSMAVRPGGRSNRGGRKRLRLVSSAVISMLFIITMLVVPNLQIEAASINPVASFTKTLEDEVNVVGSRKSRKLLQMTAICSKNDVVIYQGSTEPLPSGIPAFTVEILNVCVSDCYITNIHVSCGWFSSVHLVNPQVFRRVDFDDCVVNNGEVLGPGQSLSFQYANSFQYPLSVSSVDCS